MEALSFYYDLGSPYAYLAAERITRHARPVRWRPVLLGGLFKLSGRSSWGVAPESRAAGMAEVERRTALYGLPALRWPDPWPGDMLTAMRAATYAAEAGAPAQFALAAFRLAFVEGRDLSEREMVLEAAERAGLGTTELVTALASSDLKARLRAATDAAHARGVVGVPTFAVGGQLIWGDDRLDAALA